MTPAPAEVREQGMHSPIAVANRFLEMAEDKGISLTPMHLQKLVYIAHGWSLAVFGNPLTNKPIEAWDWGPVYRELYQASKMYGSGAVTAPLKEQVMSFVDRVIQIGNIVAIERFDAQELDLLNAIFENYADLRAFQLSALTHKEGTPWSRVYDGGAGRNHRIPDHLIKEHFDAIGRSPS